MFKKRIFVGFAECLFFLILKAQYNIRIHFYCRNAVLSHGMFDQIRVDGGKEFYLMLGVQEIFQNLRSNQTIVSYRQTQSRQVITFCSFFHNKRMGEDIKERRIHFLFYKNHENLRIFRLPLVYSEHKFQTPRIIRDLTVTLSLACSYVLTNFGLTVLIKLFLFV